MNKQTELQQSKYLKSKRCRHEIEGFSHLGGRRLPIHDHLGLLRSFLPVPGVLGPASRGPPYPRTLGTERLHGVVGGSRLAWLRLGSNLYDLLTF